MLTSLAAGSLAILWALYHQGGIAVTVDGMAYLSPPPRPSPYHLRWLLPMLLGSRIWAWCIVSWASLLATCVLFPGGALLWAGLPWFRTMAQAPVLVDAPAMALALLTLRRPACCWGIGWAVSERFPILAALISGSPWPLLGLLGVAALSTRMEHGPGDSPLRVGLDNAPRLASLHTMLLPWGVGLLALLSPGWTVREVALVAVAYGQMLVAHDSVRLYQWAAPVVLPKAWALIPARWRMVAVVLHWLNPWAWLPRGRVIV
jgi:hypothetical protein